MVFLSPFLSKWAHERVVRGSTSRLFFSFFPFLLLFSPKKCVSERTPKCVRERSGRPESLFS